MEKKSDSLYNVFNKEYSVISIYDYIDPGLYLRDVYQNIKVKNPSFSIRSWAKHLEMKHHNPLFEMLAGKRKISSNYIPLFIRTLNLDVNEGFYFDTLVGLQRSLYPQEKELYLERLRSLSPRMKLRMNEVDTFNSLKDPIHVIITELSCLKGFKSDARWIKDKLGFETTIGQINDAIERLLSLGLMTRDDKGQLKKTHQHLYSKSDVFDTGLQEYHKNVMILAGRAVENQSVHEREYNAFCINIDKKRLPEMKKYLRKFMNDFAVEFEAKEKTVNDTYQLNTQFFNLTKKIPEHL